jgi:hypothetical protein
MMRDPEYVFQSGSAYYRFLPNTGNLISLALKHLTGCVKY